MPKNNWFTDMIVGIFDLISTGNDFVDRWVKRIISFGILLLLIGLSVDLSLLTVAYLMELINGIFEVGVSGGSYILDVMAATPEATVPAVSGSEIPIVDG